MPVKKHARSSLKGGGGFPCRALMIRAVPNISVPCRAKILVPTKNGELERRSLSKICEGARGAAGPPPGGLGGWKPPRNSRGSGGRQPPSKNNFMDPEPGFWDQNLSRTYREPNYGSPLVNLWCICRESVVNLSWACPRCQQLFPV